MRTLFYFILAFFFCSCSEKQQQQDVIYSVDEIVLHHKTPTDTSKISYTDPSKISIFKEIVNANREDINTNSECGVIKYMKNGHCVFTVTMTTEGCKYCFESDTFKTRMTYQVGQVWNGL